METLPALKITHFNGEPARGQVYAYLRCYVRDGEIPFSVTVFDETPPHTARFGFAVTPDDAAGTYLFASCTKQQGDALWLYRTGEPADVPLRRLEMPPMRHLAGSDEQGFYWSAEGVLPAQAFRTAFGRVPRVGGILPGNAFLYDVSEPAFGAAFPVPTGAGVPTAAGFGTCLLYTSDLVHDTLGALYRKLHIRSPFLNALRHMAPAFRPKPAALKLCRTALPVLYTAVRAFPMVYILK